MSNRRALHYVYRVGDRAAALKFYRDILGMKVLRHEEFEAGCDAACNGPYDGKWSKTMIGYGAEDNNFVCELTYNYGISGYKEGNNYIGLFIRSAAAAERALNEGFSAYELEGHKVIKDKGGYQFYILPEPQPRNKDPVYMLALASTDLERTASYWRDLLEMQEISVAQSDRRRFCYGDGQAILEFRKIDGSMFHAGGRVAFSCPSSQLKDIEARVKEAGHSILTPFISLDTPGKATVQVVILADPDGHEICFVGDEGFRELSQVDPLADKLLTDAIAKDDSDAWFAKHGGKQNVN